MARKSIDWMKTMPELLNEWDYEKNNIMPSDISIWSKKFLHTDQRSVLSPS